MNNFGNYITPTQAKERGDTRSLEELQELSKRNGTCMNCDEKEWRNAGCGLCFSCTVGEADASEDTELIEE